MTRHPARLAVGALMLAALAGCANAPVRQSGEGGQQTTVTPSRSAPQKPAPPSSSTAPPSSSVPPGSKTPPRDRAPSGRVPPEAAKLPQARIDASGAPRTRPTGAWLADDGRTLYVSAPEQACTLLHGKVLGRNDAAVRIGLSSDKVQTFAACPQRVVRATARVDIGGPLGDRRLVFIDAG